MSALSWEDMARQVLVAGRPADVTSAALGWQALLGNIDEVKRLLDADIHDLGDSWKGPAYDAFRTHMEGLTKQAESIVDGAREPGSDQHSIVTVLQTAAQDLERAQNAMPVPQGCVGDLAAARNGAIVIDTGLFEASIRADFAGSWPVEKFGQLNDRIGEFFNDNTEDARKAYDRVSDDYADRERETPGGALLDGYTDGGPSGVNLEGPPGTGGAGNAAGLGGGPSTGGLGGEPSLATGYTGSGGAGYGSGAHPDLSSGAGGYDGYDGSDGSAPSGSGKPSVVGNDLGGGALVGEYSSGLASAGAGTGTLTGVNSGFGAGGGLPSATGLGAGGGGLGGTAGLGGASGHIPGGGSLGRPVSLGMPPMMGGAAGTGGAGRGAKGPSSSRGGAAMTPGMVGAGGRGGAGSTGARAAGGGVRGGLTGTNSGADDGNEESQHGTWLREDDDVWGADDDGTDGVLR
ncbi:WXG100 family type VII secretion target [Micromonospora sp. DT201]|uniref:WXG100 family type VII secretion target n=1 Tax=Micromonospora sp. DT201 TaxID=3393442 RepID=UPI003CFB0FD6